MMQVVPKWKVVARTQSKEHVFWCHDQFLSNVLNRVASMQFTENGLEQPIEIVVTAVAVPSQVVGLTTALHS